MLVLEIDIDYNFLYIYLFPVENQRDLYMRHIYANIFQRFRREQIFACSGPVIFVFNIFSYFHNNYLGKLLSIFISAFYPYIIYIENCAKMC